MTIQRISSEGDIPSLKIDWTKVAEEVKAIDEKHNGVRKQEDPKLAKQTPGNMYVVKNQHRAGFLENDIPAPEKKAETEMEQSLPKKLSRFHDPENRLQGRSSIAPAYYQSGHGVQDVGGPKKFIKSESSPTIFDTDKLIRLFDKPSAKEETKSEKEHIAKVHSTLREERTRQIVDALQEVDQRKSSSVTPSGDQQVSSEQSRFGKPKNHIGLFDRGEFDNLPELTAGEKLSKAKRERVAKKDDSWRYKAGSINTRQILERFVNDLGEGNK